MADIVSIKPDTRRARTGKTSGDAAEVVIFPGVRYERLEEVSATGINRKGVSDPAADETRKLDQPA